MYISAYFYAYCLIIILAIEEILIETEEEEASIQIEIIMKINKIIEIISIEIITKIIKKETKNMSEKKKHNMKKKNIVMNSRKNIIQ